MDVKPQISKKKEKIVHCSQTAGRADTQHTLIVYQPLCRNGTNKRNCSLEKLTSQPLKSVHTPHTGILPTH